ncbi:MAG: protein kinase [Anaerolineae bacterium]|nr:protein kinase [Anaerolineae bacterium]NUQ06885.1 protein kinase [Anaerolineae bacterium]
MQNDPLVGKQISAFKVEAKIGQGGMASVYRAHQASVNRSVALKVISVEAAEGRQDEFRQRFAQEARLIATLEHIHILPIYEYGIVDNLAFIAMRLLRGGTLSDLLVDGGMEINRAADLFTQMARGLSYAHSHGVLHRDLKPSNILLDDTGNAYLSDFGLAKLTENPVTITRTDTIVGTPAYMSPEQLRGELLDARSDIYSLGVILYHMLTGNAPFQASDNNVISIIYQHLEKQPDPPSNANPALPPAVDEVVLKAMAKTPDERYPSAVDLAAALNAALGRSISTGSFPMVQPPTPPSFAAPRPPSAASTASSPTLTALPVQPASRPLMVVIGVLTVALITLVVLMAAGVLTLPAPPPTATPSPTPIPRAVVLDGEIGRGADAQPTEAEIATARARISGSGFVAYAACVQSSQYHAAQAREISEFAAAYGLPFRIYNADNDAYIQVTQIEQARTDGVTGLIICPKDIALLDEALRSAEAAGLPMVFMAAEIENYGGVLLAGDDERMGLAAGRAIGEIVRDERGGAARVVILDFPTMPQIVTRADGLEAGLLENAPDAVIVGRYLGGTRDDGQRSVERLLEEDIAFDVILSINDAGSYGAIAALEAAGIPPEAVIIGSIDAEPLARQHIAEGYYLRASVDVGRAEFSRAAVDSLVRLMAGATMPETLLVPPGVTITRDSAAEASAEATAESAGG